MSNLIYTRNHDVPRLFSKIIEWAKDRNIIKGSTPQGQFTKLLEEVIELYSTLHPDKTGLQVRNSILDLTSELYFRGKIDQAPSGKTIEDDVGDCVVVLTIISEMQGLTMQKCISQGYSDIEHRKGEMIDGIFVKESDLIKEL